MLRPTDFIIDCPDTMKLAAFYSGVMGLPVKQGSNENWAGIQLGEIELAFVHVEDYRAPQWPDSEHPKQFHLDFEVDDIEAEQRRVMTLGATLMRDCVGPDGYGFRISPTRLVTPSASAATRVSSGPIMASSGPSATRTCPRGRPTTREARSSARQRSQRQASGGVAERVV